MQNTLIVIPAIKKNAVIPDQLIKKLNGITLIQRAINTAKKVTNNILIITDSQEISLIAHRNEIEYYYDTSLQINSSNILTTTLKIITESTLENIIIYRANTPLIDEKIIQDAYEKYIKINQKSIVLTSVKILDKQLYKLKESKLAEENDVYFKELKAFYIFSKKNTDFNYIPYKIDEEHSIEIENYQDWWICEHLLQRKCIVFNVIGSTLIGMGHIYHSLALAHEITNHEIIFVCEEQYEMAVEKITSMDYKVISTKDITKTIIELKPDLVLNDVLDTQEEYIKLLKKNDITVVNFEDLGEGALYADMVINELYDTPQIEGNNFLWGFKYITLRDEFENARAHEFSEKVTSVLVTFGGTDQNNLTLLSLKTIVNICEQKSIKIYIVCGGGYLYKKELEEYLKKCRYKNIELTYALNVISQIMEKTQIAISSNGRTVYELADMNIPSIVISHHKREDTHTFASLDKGFINLGIVDEYKTKEQLLDKFEKLVSDKDYRELLYLNVKKYSFRYNKRQIVERILELI